MSQWRVLVAAGKGAPVRCLSCDEGGAGLSCISLQDNPGYGPQQAYPWPIKLPHSLASIHNLANSFLNSQHNLTSTSWRYLVHMVHATHRETIAGENDDPILLNMLPTSVMIRHYCLMYCQENQQR